MIVADIPLPGNPARGQSAGRFVVHQKQDGQTVGILSTSTPFGPLHSQCDLPDVDADTGRALTELEIAPFDFAAASINDVLQDAVGAAGRYAQTIGRFESPDTHEAFHVIMKAALEDMNCRRFLSDMVHLSRARTNEEFNAIQSQIQGAPETLSASLATMTPEQVQALSAHYRRAYGLIQDALPWLSQPLRELVGQLREGRFGQARESMLRRYKTKYVDRSPNVQNEVGRADPVEHYTAGGAPINVGKYRECTGCTCPDPCADGNCESCCECSGK
jgi:hypothetical protein